MQSVICRLLFQTLEFRIRMWRRLEKYHLFCNTAFLSLFTMKFVRHLYIRQSTLYVGTKKACKLYLKFLIYIGSFRHIYTTKYTVVQSGGCLTRRPIRVVPSQLSRCYHSYVIYVTCVCYEMNLY